MSLVHRRLGGRISPGSLAELEELRRAGADLRGAILRGVDLSGADLAGVDLSGADLTDSILRGANLAGARLERALAQGADLRGANLSGARCEWAVFGLARLDEADFRGAVVARASLVGASARRARFDEADLTFARLASADLRGARFDSAIVQRCIVRASDARGASLDAATGTPTIDRTRRGPLSEGDAAVQEASSRATATALAPRAPMLLAHFMHVVGPFESNAYLMADEASGAPALLVDAGGYGPGLRSFLEERGLPLAAILLTHHHPDHVVALPEILAAHPGVAVVSPAPIEAAPHARIVGEGDRVEAAGFEFEVFRLSGHTPESVGFHCRAAGVCCTGDAIFAGSVGGTASEELHAEELSNLRRTVLALPAETELLSGHGPATTVRIELGGNPFLREGFGRS